MPARTGASPVHGRLVNTFAAVAMLAAGASGAVAQPSASPEPPTAPPDGSSSGAAPAPAASPASHAAAPASQPTSSDAGLAAELAAAERRAAEATTDEAAEAALEPERSGLTFEVSVGVGGIYVAVDKADDSRHPSQTGINVGVGGFVEPRAALGVRIASLSTTQRDIMGTAVRTTTAFAGPTLQYWASDRVFVGVGLGVGFAYSDLAGVGGVKGLAGDLRLGYNVHRTRNHAFYAAAEVTPALYDTSKHVGVSLQLGWQML